MRAAVYARVSTKDGRQTTENQLRQLRTYCQRRGWDLAREYVEDESGTRGRGERRQLDRMLREAAQQKFDVLVVWDLSRLTREGIRVTLGYLDRLEAAGVRFVDYSDPTLSTLNPAMRELWVSVKAWVNRTEAQRISERTKAGLERARAKGTKLGRPSKQDVALPVVRELKEQTRLDGDLTHKEIAQIVKRRTGTKVSTRTISRCVRQLEEKSAPA